MLEIFIHSGVNLPVERNSENPTVLIHSGTHGDEAAIILIIAAYIKTHRKRLPPFLWVKEVSPSAVRFGTRHNERGVDLNRAFVANPADPEVMANLALLQGYHFSLFVSFHMDLTTSAFYLYDSAGQEKDFWPLFDEVERLGVSLYDGMDDEHDLALGNRVVAGYVSEAHASTPGSSDAFFREKGIVNGRLVTVEIPGRLVPQKQREIIAKVFEHIILHPTP